MRTRNAFTLIELLVVVAIVTLLVSILLPALGVARWQGRVARDLANIRQLETAHYAYMTDNGGRMIRVGLAHGGVHSYDLHWFNTLREYGSQILDRSPLDWSTHFGPAPTGDPIPGSPPTQRRVTSYGVNNFLDEDTYPYSIPAGWTMGPYKDLSDVPRPSSTIHFLHMAYEGEFAGADHPHIENWFTHPSPPFRAAQQVQIDAVKGPDPARWNGAAWSVVQPSRLAVSNWGYLDGHAATQAFEIVFTNITRNRFDPNVAQ